MTKQTKIVLMLFLLFYIGYITTAAIFFPIKLIITIGSVLFIVAFIVLIFVLAKLHGG